MHTNTTTHNTTPTTTTSPGRINKVAYFSYQETTGNVRGRILSEDDRWIHIGLDADVEFPRLVIEAGNRQLFDKSKIIGPITIID